jgi:type III restriction enzyme
VTISDKQTTDRFFEEPILNSPYMYPGRHWELDQDRRPTGLIVERRRVAEFLTAIPRPKNQKGQQAVQQTLNLGGAAGLSTPDQEYDPTPIINEIRARVDAWRQLRNPRDWHVTPDTQRLLHHWREHEFQSFRPFFCQVEAVETAIWLTEVAPGLGKDGDLLLDYLNLVSGQFNDGLMRLALKLATGAGKTTVMAMIIAWQTVNALRHPNSRKFTRGFLVVTPGITIRDRLRELQANDPDSYYARRELVPADMLPDLDRAKIVITNFHAFKLRERWELSKGGRLLLQGRGAPLQTLETEGQMIRRVMPELMGLKGILVLNDEAHHCYREKQSWEDDDESVWVEDKQEAEENTETARIWFSGLQAVDRTLGIRQVVDLSATPFFLSGSKYREGTLFPWTMSDFSLMDAIECGIVKLPRVPVADNIPDNEVPMFRNLWEHIRDDMPKRSRTKGVELDPLKLPPPLQTALEALYGHYAQTFARWDEANMGVPPCFIVVCNNTATSKLVYEFISGFERFDQDGTRHFQNGRFELFRNYDENGNPVAYPRSLLIDSKQLESGNALDDSFRAIAADEIARFRREIVERTRDIRQAENLTDADLLREVTNTVGKRGRLGESIRCVVSVAMLTEGWDANTVTHVLGVRAFGTQLLCEQVVGRSLRRQSYDLNEKGLFDVEYADVLGIPFDFTAKPVPPTPRPPHETVHVFAVRPERDHLEIRFPRVLGYRVDLPNEQLTAKFDANSTLHLTPDLVGATETRNSGIIGKPVDLSLAHLGDVRQSQIVYELAAHLLLNKLRQPGESPKYHLFGDLRRIAKEWLDDYLICDGGTHPAQLKYVTLADLAGERISAGITRTLVGSRPIKAILDPYNPTGSTAGVNFTTSKDRFQPNERLCHLNWIVVDDEWDAAFCRMVESDGRVKGYVKNQGLGFEVPYMLARDAHAYSPDFIVVVDDGHGYDDLLHLVVEARGYRGRDTKQKKATMETRWVPGVNNLGIHGRWAFAELTRAHAIQTEEQLKTEFATIINAVSGDPVEA